jgi:hypothetical protein
VAAAPDRSRLTSSLLAGPSRSTAGTEDPWTPTAAGRGIELLQWALPLGRVVSPVDAALNATGAVVAGLLVSLATGRPAQALGAPVLSVSSTEALATACCRYTPPRPGARMVSPGIAPHVPTAPGCRHR